MDANVCRSMGCSFGQTSNKLASTLEDLTVTVLTKILPNNALEVLKASQDGPQKVIKRTSKLISERKKLTYNKSIRSLRCRIGIDNAYGEGHVNEHAFQQDIQPCNLY
ncbi:hypothetical protein GJ496_000150 [Pomphorhynchus laevis]|nr:hypothetical protein GJ496_000150 [Pomphorhynchus laevis]